MSQSVEPLKFQGSSEVTTSQSGWESFVLDYHVDSPLNLLLTGTVMGIYVKIFRFNWRLNRCEFILTESWRNWLALYRQVCNKSQRRNLLLKTPFSMLAFNRVCSMISAMLIFIRQILFYVQVRHSIF